MWFISKPKVHCQNAAAPQGRDCNEVGEDCANGPFSHSHTHTAHLSCWPHIVLALDNRLSYIMKPIHIKGCSGDALAWLQAPREQAKTTWENETLCSLSSHGAYRVQENGHVLLIICALNKYCSGHLICCGGLCTIHVVYKIHSSWHHIVRIRERKEKGVADVKYTYTVRVNDGSSVLSKWPCCKIWCSHRVHSQVALPTLGYI